MAHTFVIEPAAFQAFENEDEQLERCKEWGLLSEKAVKPKDYLYKGNNLNLSCSIVGFVDPFTVVIEFDNKQKHCIHPAYLKEMQAGSFNQKLLTLAEESDSNGEAEAQEPKRQSKSVQDIANTPVEPKEPAAASSPTPDKSDKPVKPAKPAKSRKLDLPGEKVKMTAIVKEFALVPNHFTETDDEVVVYEPVSIIEPALELGSAWSSHSATLKKLELAEGDALTFEAKVVAKKLTKHPVPYKINNPSKIVKQEP